VLSASIRVARPKYDSESLVSFKLLRRPGNPWHHDVNHDSSDGPARLNVWVITHNLESASDGVAVTVTSMPPLVCLTERLPARAPGTGTPGQASGCHCARLGYLQCRPG
jgi:hypothetical protein